MIITGRVIISAVAIRSDHSVLYCVVNICSPMLSVYRFSSLK